MSRAIHIGFTGTQRGITMEQRLALHGRLNHLDKQLPKNIRLFAHHGDCIGADEQFHNIANQYMCSIHLYPCDIDQKRAWCINPYAIHEIKPPLDRNKDIVNACDLLLACPGEMTMQQRSGTWSTIRYAKKVGKEVHVIFPDGTVKVYKAKKGLLA